MVIRGAWGVVRAAGRGVRAVPRRLFGTRWRALGTVACIAALMVIASCSADRVVLGTDPGAVADTSGAVRRAIAVGGERIEFWVARWPGARDGRAVEAMVLFFPGKGSRAEAWTGMVAQAWGERAVEVWGMNWPGFGGTSGPARLDR